ncbi:MAG: TolC family outer membrane protein [Gammaproteobacteria bacterium]|nr:TolC family outer membrane protein [Gammaproteobacteria bacterium]
MSAQTVQAENLLELWPVAVAQDGEYQAARHRYLADQESINQSRALLLPNLSLQYESKTTDQKINSSDNAVFNSDEDKYDTTTAGITLTQSIFDYSRWQRYSQSKITVNKAEVEFNLARQHLLLRLAESYFLVLERGDQLETVVTEKSAMKKHLELSERKLKAGLGRRVDVEDSRARYLNALSKDVELQSRLEDSRYGLREVIGSIPRKLMALRPNIELQPPVPDDVEQWITQSSQNNLELRALSLSVEVAQKEINALRGGHYPTLDLVYNDVNTDTDGSIYGGGSDIDSADLMLQLNIPLYSGGATSSKVRQAAEKRYGLMADINDKRRTVEREAQDAFNRIRTSIVQVNALDQSVKAQESLLQSKSRGYRNGKNSILEVLDAQQDLSHASQALTKARYDYVLNILRLKFAAGDLQEQDLATVNGWLQ